MLIKAGGLGVVACNNKTCNTNSSGSASRSRLLCMLLFPSGEPALHCLAVTAELVVTTSGQVKFH